MKGELKTAPSEVAQVLIAKTLDRKQAPTFQRFEKLMKWADKIRRLGIRTNADQPDQAANAICVWRDGHRAVPDGAYVLRRRPHLRDARDDYRRDEEAREAALKKLLPLQRDDFAGIFRAMKGYPVTIRTLDPPLHEFLPHDRRRNARRRTSWASARRRSRNAWRRCMRANPMLGHRGCRLGITYPEITEMQTRAIIEAAIQVRKEGIPVKPRS